MAIAMPTDREENYSMSSLLVTLLLKASISDKSQASQKLQ